MTDRFVVTGCGRSGTHYLSRLLTTAGLPCGHERVFNAGQDAGRWPSGLRADSSWMAATMLDRVDVPVVLLVRHPLAVVRSWVEIGFFGWDAENPTHGPLRSWAPAVYQHPTPQDRVLEMWVHTTGATLRRAEAMLRLEQIDAAALARLLSWAGSPDPARADRAFEVTPQSNQHDRSRQLTGVEHEPVWSAHADGELVDRARYLAALLGYDPEVVPGG